MEKLSIGDSWEKDEPKRQAHLAYLKKHPLSREQIDQQFKRNQEMRQKNGNESREGCEITDKMISIDNHWIGYTLYYDNQCEEIIGRLINLMKEWDLRKECKR